MDPLFRPSVVRAILEEAETAIGVEEGALFRWHANFPFRI